ncbi:MAG: sigma-70 family RNA polymerase sigma factor [Actinomycetota bacterium]
MHTALLGSEPPVVIVPPAELSDARDRDLLRQISDGDQEAFRRLFRQYAPTAQSLARRIVIQQFLAEEILQEAFLAVWKRPEAFDSERGSVRAWLMSLVHHRAVDAVRREEAQRRRAKDAVLDQPVVEEDPAATVVEELGLPGERAAVRAALSEIPEEQRRVIELMYFGGLSQSKIAEQLELPLGTVKSRTLLGMRRLRGALLGMER